ncbi:ADP-ribose diphosphatase [Acrasis kona]|uniref:ADP-ribose diphosphatase n=1 Tax=Acrasis kona TaxID=1008807 RepID=A0AAW2YX72_9EUKA
MDELRPTDEKIVLKAVHKHIVVNHEQKFLRLSEYTYTDENGKDRLWDACERTTRKGEVDGVEIVAILKSEHKEDHIILVSQYRPPLKAYSIEFPAGLLDENEDAPTAALRELKEETGYTGVVTSTSPILAMEPGLTNANTIIVNVTVDADLDYNQSPKQELDETENIEVLILPVKNLLPKLDHYSKMESVVDAKVYMMAYTLSISNK